MARLLCPGPRLAAPGPRRRAGRAALRGAALLALLLTSACASVGGVGQGDRAMVRLYDGDTGVLLELANDSHPDWQDVYSRPRPAANLKLVPEDVLSSVLEALDAAGFDRWAADGPAPPMSAGLDGWLEVRLGDRARTLSIAEGSLDRERLSGFARMKLAVLDAYQSVAGLQLIENPAGHDLFQTGARGGR